MSEEVFNRISQMERFFGNSKRYHDIIQRAINAFERGDLKVAEDLLDCLPTETKLLEEITQKLKRKSVYETLQRIAKKQETSVFEALKGYFSLGTHIAIECEKGHTEYTLLLSMIHNRLGSLIYTGGEE